MSFGTYLIVIAILGASNFALEYFFGEKLFGRKKPNYFFTTFMTILWAYIFSGSIK